MMCLFHKKIPIYLYMNRNRHISTIKPGVLWVEIINCHYLFEHIEILRLESIYWTKYYIQHCTCPKKYTIAYLSKLLYTISICTVKVNYILYNIHEMKRDYIIIITLLTSDRLTVLRLLTNRRQSYTSLRNLPSRESRFSRDIGLSLKKKYI